MPRTLLWLAIVGLSTVVASAQPAVTSDNIDQRIAEVGPHTTVAEMYADPSIWTAVLSGVSSGEANWIKVAIKLRQSSDAAASQELELALGEALEHQPQAVLEIAGPALGLQVICAGPDVDDKRYDSYALSIRAIDARVAMVRSLSDTRVAAARERCLGALEASKSGLARFYKVDQ
jgi:hypothetical protein